jgi:6-phosphogluconolactonase
MKTERGELVILEDPLKVAHAAAEQFVRAARAVLADRRRFSVALAGGSTPRATYEILAQQMAARVDWGAVEVFFGDERCVPPDDKDSNYRMAREALLDHVPLGADRVHRMLGERPPEEAAASYAEVLTRVLGAEARLDLIMLGMGPDGHTASLFPGTAALEERAKKVVANHVAKLDTWRLTLSAPEINLGHEVLIVTCGDEKADALAQVFHAPQGTVPIQLVRPLSGQVTWLVDKKAAAKLRL